MKRLTTILCLIVLLITLGCAGVTVAPESLIISAEELTEHLQYYCFPISSWIHTHFFKFRGTAVAATIYMPDGLIVHYAYLDRGELVGFKLDREKGTYSRDEMVPDIVKFLTNSLSRILRGLPPFESARTFQVLK